jgi:8-oxo-dGTP diphosphatase
VLPGHGDLVTAAVRRLRSLLWHTNAGGCLLPEEFTLSELQALYEAVEGRPLDKRNFRKWVLSNHLVDPTPRERRDGAHRPARLYCFRSRELVTPD